MAILLEPRWNPGPRKVVGATGFEPATPRAQAAPFAMLCDVLQPAIGFKQLNQKRLWRGSPHDVAGNPYRGRNPNGTPQAPYDSRPGRRDPLLVKQSLMGRKPLRGSRSTLGKRSGRASPSDTETPRCAIGSTTYARKILLDVTP